MIRRLRNRLSPCPPHRRVDVPSFTILAVHGPVRPVVVVEVAGEVDRSTDIEVLRRLRAVRSASTDRSLCRTHFGARTVSSLVVVDFRPCTFVSMGSLVTLAGERDASGLPLRLVLRRESSLNRAARVLDLRSTLDIYDDLTEALLQESR